MNVAELLILAVGLSMDAFAAAVCKGLAMNDVSLKRCLLVGAWFGGFQGLMPTIGYLLGRQFYAYVESFSSWIAFALLLLIGGNMIKEAFEKDADKANDSTAFMAMLVLALATSIDALAAGITFAALKTDLPLAAGLTGVITFVLSAAGVKAGNLFGSRYRTGAELTGGIVLVLLGV